MDLRQGGQEPQKFTSEDDGPTTVLAGGQLAIRDGLVEFGPTNPRDNARLSERQTLGLQFALNIIQGHSSVTVRTSANVGEKLASPEQQNRRHDFTWCGDLILS